MSAPPRRRPPESQGRGEEGGFDEGGSEAEGVLGVKEKEGVYIYICVKITTKYPIIHSELYF